MAIGLVERDAQQSQPFKILSVAELMKLPPPSWLIEGVIEEGAFGVLYGASGEGKSFVALDWALSIATNRKWQGREVKRGTVVYIVAEGGRNVSKRVKAWMAHNGLGHQEDLDGLLVILEAVHFRDSRHPRELTEQLRASGIKPQLVVVDTLARCFHGGDENSAQDMGAFVEECNRVQRETGGAVLAVHHTAKPSGTRPKQERGSYALRGAADAMIQVHQTNGVIRIKVDKQKDDELGQEIFVRLKPTVAGVDRESGRDITSCVLVAADSVASKPDQILPENTLRALRTLVDMPERVAQSGKWRKAIRLGKGSPITDTTFYRYRNELLDAKLIEPVQGRRHTYRATELGTSTSNGMPSEFQRQSLNLSATTATPHVNGGAGGTEVGPREEEPGDDLSKPGARVRI